MTQRSSSALLAALVAGVILGGGASWHYFEGELARVKQQVPATAIAGVEPAPTNTVQTIEQQAPVASVVVQATAVPIEGAAAIAAPVIAVAEYPTTCTEREELPVEELLAVFEGDENFAADHELSLGGPDTPELDLCSLPLKISVERLPVELTSVDLNCSTAWKLETYDGEAEILEVEHRVTVPIEGGMGSLTTVVAEKFPAEVVTSNVMRTDTSCSFL